MNSTTKIALSFLPVATADFTYTIYRRKLGDRETSVPGTRHLPEDCGAAINARVDRHRYEVRLRQHDGDGFEEVRVAAWVDQGLTDDVLYQALVERAQSQVLRKDTELSDRQFVKEVGFVLARHEDAREVMRLRPYGLNAIGRFGFLCRFSLRVPETSQISDRQRLELSLTHKNGRLNEDYYLDQNQKIEIFLKQYFTQIATLTLHDDSRLQLEAKLSVVPSFTLARRTYVFGNGREARNQFFGLRDHGPYQYADDKCYLVFLFTKEDRERSQHLFRALRGDTYSTFTGMKPMFGTEIGRDNVSGLAVTDFSNTEMEAACATLEEKFPDKRIVPVALVPFTKHSGNEEEARGYFSAKHAFLHHGIASQFVDRKRTQDRNALKWSISNIGLGLFAKMGGIPWRVKPSTNRCLIVGIGQAHRKVEGKIERFIAYSVLTDSAGGYEMIKMLGESDSEEQYLIDLGTNLREVLISHRDRYDSFVLHVTFNMRQKEIDTIQGLLSELKGSKGVKSEFVAIKFNDKNDFFGFSVDHNSRVPFEGTVAPLSRRDYLMWFSGLSLDDAKIPKKPEKPVHLRILYPKTGLAEADLKRVLQDAFNIAGANWRGFNAKSIPISVYYSKIIADYYGHFREAGLAELDFENVSPWFL